MTGHDDQIRREGAMLSGSPHAPPVGDIERGSATHRISTVSADFSDLGLLRFQSAVRFKILRAGTATSAVGTCEPRPERAPRPRWIAQRHAPGEAPVPGCL